MNYAIGDGMASIALVGGIVWYVHIVHRSRQKQLEIIHQERLAAMEKGIPLPEFPLTQRQRRNPLAAGAADHGDRPLDSCHWSDDRALLQSPRSDA